MFLRPLVRDVHTNVEAVMPDVVIANVLKDLMAFGHEALKREFRRAIGCFRGVRRQLPEKKTCHEWHLLHMFCDGERPASLPATE